MRGVASSRAGHQWRQLSHLVKSGAHLYTLAAANWRHLRCVMMANSWTNTKPRPMTMQEKASVASLRPAGKDGSTALNRLADSIVRCNELAPDRWGLSVLEHGVRLNFGKIEVMTVDRIAVRMLVDFDTLPEVFPDCEGFSLVVRDVDDPGAGFYKSVPGSVICMIEVANCTGLSDCIHAVEQSHLALLRKASLTGRNPMTAKSHSEATITEIANLIGRSLPQPAYLSHKTL